MKKLIMIVLLLRAFIIFGQMENMDSLRKLLQHDISEIETIEIKLKIAQGYKNHIPDSGLFYSQTVAAQANQLNLPLLEAKANVLIGYILDKKGNYELAVNFFHQGLRKYKDLGMKKETVEVLNQLSRACSDALLLEVAESHIREAIEISRELGDTFHLAMAYCNYAYNYEDAFQPEKALVYYNKADSINKRLNNSDLDFIIKEGFASVYEDMGMHDRAKKYYLLVNPMLQNNIYELIDNINNLGDTYRKKGKFSDALPYYLKATKLASDLNVKRKIAQNYKDLAFCYEGLKDFQKAARFYRKHIDLYFESYDKMTSEHITQMQILYEVEQKNNEIQLQKANARNRTFQRNMLIIGLALAILTGFYFFYSFLKHKKLNNTLASQKLEISYQNQKLKENQRELNKTLNELKNTQTALINNEKMASLGTLISGVAHEINNPLNFIHGSLQVIEENLTNGHNKSKISKNTFSDEEVDVKELISNAFTGIQSISNIVQSLNKFSHGSDAKKTLEDINDIIESTLVIIHSKIPANVKVEKRYGDLQKILCYQDKMHQVFLNIIDNAIHAVEQIKGSKKPKIIIKTYMQGHQLYACVSNNGPKIPPNIKNRLYDPFFTTKAPGKGVGLGLSISYTIVNEHDGELTLFNEEGNVKFCIVLPV